MKIFSYVIFGLILAGGITFPSFVDGNVYETIEFYVDKQYESGGNFVEKAIHLTSSIRARFYVEKDYYDALTPKNQELFLDRVANIGVIFDRNVYLQLKTIFGDEWSPGIDNDRMITVYITEMKSGVDGYFRELDEYNVVDSNKREMIYINARYIDQGRGSAVLAHEFQHLINFNQKKRLRGVIEETWLNEALSEYAVTALGLNNVDEYLRRMVRDFLANPTDALGLWEEAGVDNKSVSLFMHYLIGRYGEEIIKDIVQSKFIGGDAINYALEKNGFDEKFSDVFVDWTVALFLNFSLITDLARTPFPGYGNTAVSGKRRSQYEFQHPDLQYNNLHIMPQLNYLVGDSGANAVFAVRDLAPEWHRFLPAKYDSENPKTLRVDFNGRGDYYFRVPIIVTYLSGEIEVLETEIKNGSGMAEVLNFNKDVSSVVIVPASHTKLSDFSPRDPLRTFSYSVSLVLPSLPPPGNGDTAVTGWRQHGDLIRVDGYSEVYVIKDGFRRHLQYPVFFDFYEHLKWENVEVIPRNVVENYEESKFIRKAGDYKVYEVTGFRQTRWLDMTPREFEASGRKWEAVYEVNQNEFDWYLSS